MSNELPQEYRSGGFFTALVVVGALAVGFALFIRSAMRPTESAQLNHEFPPIEAIGWINGPGPTAEELSGKVIVVDAWAFWCGPCRAAIPSLIGLHQKFKDRGVTFLGLTSEGLDAESIQQSRTFVESQRIPWANGYGAIKTLSKLEVDSIPQLWVVDKQNRIVFHEIGWSPRAVSEIEQVLIKAIEDSPTLKK